VVTQCRRLLEDSVSQELQGKFGIYAGKNGSIQIDNESRMSHLSMQEKLSRRDILAHMAHIESGSGITKDKGQRILEQLVREIAFTHLNRLCAYKMMEARQVYVGDQRFREAVSRGVNSNGVKFFLAEHPDDERLFTSGQQDVAYRHFLDWLGGLLSEEIGVLFSPHDPANRLYPPQRVLDEVLALINDEALADIWTQDETIGWVYQYFTPKELRDQARKESQAPRNSYELAFRNQFFTPRYVVEFLTDNTLGRIWYEMRKGDTKLKDQCRYMVRRPTEVFLSEGATVPGPSSLEGTKDEGQMTQDELLKQPVYIPHRPKKDPRQLKILDPACGSGHFLLYCFDLLLTIYEEAYADPDLGPALQRDYPTLDALQWAVPGLILRHNLHGIDIDLRAVQIAALALWLRCQRAYQEMGLKKDRPKITRSNFVCAEPMPGEQSMLKEFIGQLEPKLLGQLVEVVFDKMKLAGEAGSLLKIEEEIRDAVAGAKRQWLSGPVSIQRSLFDDDKPVVQQQRFDFSGISDAQFFEQAEAKVIDALRNYAEKAENGQRLQRRLFTEDAVRGFAFVDLCHKCYDVVLMNPPFGDGSKLAKSLIEKHYPRTKNDVYAAFVERGLNLLVSGGMLGAITSRTGFFLSSFQKWREEILLHEAQPTVFADLGYGVLDTAMVETAAYCLSKQSGNARTTFFRLLHVDDKQAALQRERAAPGSLTFGVEPSQFRLVPGSPFAYWVSDRIRRLFRELPPFESEGRTVRVGLQTSDDFRFVRCWWEVDPAKILDGRHGPNWRDDLRAFQDWCRQRTFAGKRWVPFAKGGEYSPFYADLHLVVNWERDGEEMKAWASPLYGNSGWSRIIKSTDYYFRPGLTWPLRGIRFSTQAVPAGGCFSVGGKLATSDDSKQLAKALIFTNTTMFDYLIGLFAGKVGGVQYEVGLIGTIPVRMKEFRIEPKQLASASDLQRTPEQVNELSHLFVQPLLPQKSAAERQARLAAVQAEIDELAFAAYGLSADERTAMTVASPPQTEEPAEQDDPDEDQSPRLTTHQSLGSYAVGCVFGRWDVRYATGERPAPPLPDPFDPLPVCSPGMLQGEDGLPLKAAPPGYPLAVQWNGILVDDPGHPHDIVRRVQEVYDLLHRSDEVPRDYFRRPGKGGFWDDHVSRYSKSRRKAPIYWLLQSSKKNYALWLYYHRLDKDLLFKALVNYVEPKIRLVESHLSAVRGQLQQAKDQGQGTKDQKRIGKEVERQEEFLSELRDFEDKLRRAANLHLEPDLNDGVVLNIAPLWELVPWKEAKKYWEELLEGKYEWSSIGKQLRERSLVRGP
jgi:hypothetical protein